MFKLLVILFIVKLYGRNNIFRRIKKNLGQIILKFVKTLENLRTKYVEAQADIKFIRYCKSENMTPTFAKVNVSLKHSNHKLKPHITKEAIESELQNKHLEKKMLKKKRLNKLE